MNIKKILVGLSLILLINPIFAAQQIQVNQINGFTQAVLSVMYSTNIVKADTAYVVIGPQSNIISTAIQNSDFVTATNNMWSNTVFLVFDTSNNLWTATTNLNDITSNSLWVATTNLNTITSNALWVATTNLITGTSNGLQSEIDIISTNLNNATNGIWTATTNLNSTTSNNLWVATTNLNSITSNALWSATTNLNSTTSNNLWVATTNLNSNTSNRLWTATTNLVTGTSNGLWIATTNLTSNYVPLDNSHYLNAVTNNQINTKLGLAIGSTVADAIAPNQPISLAQLQVVTNLIAITSNNLQQSINIASTNYQGDLINATNVMWSNTTYLVSGTSNNLWTATTNLNSVTSNNLWIATTNLNTGTSNNLWTATTNLNSVTSNSLQQGINIASTNYQSDLNNYSNALNNQIIASNNAIWISTTNLVTGTSNALSISISTTSNALWNSTTNYVNVFTTGMITQNEFNVTLGSNFVVNGVAYFNGDVWILGNLWVHNIFTTNTAITATNMNVIGSLSVNGNSVVTNNIPVFYIGPSSTNSGVIFCANANTVSPSDLSLLNSRPFLFVGADGQIARLVIDSYANGFGHDVFPNITFRSADGTAANPSNTKGQNYLANLSIEGYGGTSRSNGTYTSRAFLNVESYKYADWNDTNQGYMITFVTGPHTGSIGQQNRMRIFDDGGIEMGNGINTLSGVSPGSGIIQIDSNVVIEGSSLTAQGSIFVSNSLFVGSCPSDNGQVFTASANTSPVTDLSQLTDHPFNLVGADNHLCQLSLSSYGINQFPKILFRAANGTAASPSATTSFSILGNLAIQGYGTTGRLAQGRAFLNVNAYNGSDWSDTNQGYLVTLMTNPHGTVGQQNSMRWFDDGGIEMGNYNNTLSGTSPGPGIVLIDNALIVKGNITNNSSMIASNGFLYSGGNIVLTNADQFGTVSSATNAIWIATTNLNSITSNAIWTATTNLNSTTSNNLWTATTNLNTGTSNALQSGINIANTNYQGPLASVALAGTNYANSIAVSSTNYTGSISNNLWIATTNLVTGTSNALNSSLVNYIPYNGATGVAILQSATEITVPRPIAGNEFDAANVQWTRQRFDGNYSFYNSTNINPINTNYYSFLAVADTLSTNRAYITPATNTLLSEVMTTSTWTRIDAYPTADAYVSIVGGTAMLRANLLYSYDGTNFITIGQSSSVNVTNTTPTLSAFAFNTGMIISTNTTGFYVKRQYVVISTNGSPTIYVWLGGATPSHLTFNSLQGGVDLAANNVSINSMSLTQANVVAVQNTNSAICAIVINGTYGNTNLYNTITNNYNNLTNITTAMGTTQLLVVAGMSLPTTINTNSAGQLNLYPTNCTSGSVIFYTGSSAVSLQADSTWFTTYNNYEITLVVGLYNTGVTTLGSNIVADVTLTSISSTATNIITLEKLAGRPVFTALQRVAQ